MGVLAAPCASMPPIARLPQAGHARVQSTHLRLAACTPLRCASGCQRDLQVGNAVTDKLKDAPVSPEPTIARQLYAASVAEVPLTSCPTTPYGHQYRQRAGSLRLPRDFAPVRATAAGAAAGDPSDKEALVKGDVGEPAQAQDLSGSPTSGSRSPAGQACQTTPAQAHLTLHTLRCRPRPDSAQASDDQLNRLQIFTAPSQSHNTESNPVSCLAHDLAARIHGGACADSEQAAHYTLLSAQLTIKLMQTSRCSSMDTLTLAG